MSAPKPDLRLQAETLVRRAREFATSGDIASARNALTKAAAMFEAVGDEGRAAWSLGSAGYLAVLGKRFAEGLTLFEKAARLGYDDISKIESLAGLRTHGSRLGVLKNFREVSNKVSANAQCAAVIACVNQPIDDWRWMRFSDVKALNKLRALLPAFRDTRPVDTVRSTLAWVHRRFGHDPVNKPSRSDALTILRESRTHRRFTCQEYAVLLAGALQAQGIVARVIVGLDRNYYCGTGKGHWLNEAWCDDLGRWIALDPQNNWLWHRDGSPCGAADIRDAMVGNRKRSICAMRNGRRVSEATTWLNHFDTLWYYEQQNVCGGWNSLGAVHELSEKPHLLFQGHARGAFTHHPERTCLYPRMNRLSWKLRPRGDGLQFRFQHSFPFLSALEQCTDGKAWGVCGMAYSVTLKKGTNPILFRVRDAFGNVFQPVGLTVVERTA